MSTPDLALLVRLETEVWEALRAADAEGDAALLAADFLGVYPTGFAGRDEHADQLDGGPSVVSYELHDCRLVPISDAAALLAYRAEYVRPGSAVAESMYVSSLWCRRNDRWVNTFSQDTPAGPTVVP